MMNNYSHRFPVVLLVEDEPLVRMAAADDLQDAGFHVLEAANADVALAVLESCSHDVQVLFTDIDMPGSMNGLDLAENVQQRWPHISLLISSAYHRPGPETLPDDGRFVSKPYCSDDVVQQIRELVTSH
ncbi:response regulator [Microvirga sp. CF3062]|uniref:response regulator n=1 Tax=Microvirga sp. CF3062 TaxID=3110182 RepID=UPI002E7A7278|nr:response regulator [Microvirga sp. CF3062]MEE1655342.1 response regulator [Microvirga sp. CF3062]